MLCKRCHLEKDVLDFRKDIKRKTGYHPYCKCCESIIKKDWYLRNTERLSKVAKERRSRNPAYYLLLEKVRKTDPLFDHLLEELRVLPEICPVLKIPLAVSKNKPSFNSPSIDRLDNSKGYDPGNVWIISFLANRMKNAANDAELELFCKWIVGEGFHSSIQEDYDSSDNFRGCKERAKKNGIKFEISMEDIKVPEICPVFGVPLKRVKGSFSQYVASVDRVVPSLGYTKDNIQVISRKANTMKNSASEELLLRFAKWFLTERKNMKKSNIEVSYIDHMGSDSSVVNAARVSFAKEASLFTKEENDRLISYLARHNHKSPFNHAFMSFRVKAPIFVARQLVKHEYLPWNEVSRRYVDDEPEFFDIQWRYRPEKSVKQGSGEELSEIDKIKADKIFWDLAESSLSAYNALLELNVAPEQARAVLLIDTQTEWVWSGSLFAFAKMCNLRLDSHTQKEASEVASAISVKAKELFPISWDALLTKKY